VVEDGDEFFAKRQLVSALNYCGEFDKANQVVVLDQLLPSSLM